MEVSVWQAVAAIATVVVAAVTGLAVYVKAPKDRVGALARDAVAAADQAMDMLEEQFVARLDLLEGKVTGLEERERDLLEMVDRLERERSLLLRWIAVLTEQVANLGGIPVTIDEIQGRDIL